MDISIGTESIVNLCLNSLDGSFFANQHTSIKQWEIMECCFVFFQIAELR